MADTTDIDADTDTIDASLLFTCKWPIFSRVSKGGGVWGMCPPFPLEPNALVSSCTIK